ncbi:unnamed protein product [Discosporangium mesarthrocarpum]
MTVPHAPYQGDMCCIDSEDNPPHLLLSLATGVDLYCLLPTFQRLRVFFAGVILGLLGLNGVPATGMTPFQLTSEALAAVSGLVILLQAFLDQQKEEAVQRRLEALDAESLVAGAPAAEGMAAKEVVCVQ